MIGLVWFGAGVVTGVIGTSWWFMTDRSRGTTASVSSVKLGGKLVPSAVGNPAPDLLVPMAGFRSKDGYSWDYVVGPGDSAGNIAAAITGDDGRYQELVLANKHLETIGIPGEYVGDAWDFSQLKEGDTLRIPLPWDRYIDQLGNPRGTTTPFPLDTRVKTVEEVAAALPGGGAPSGEASAAGDDDDGGGYDEPSGARPIQRRNPNQGPAPYGKVVFTRAA